MNFRAQKFRRLRGLNRRAGQSGQTMVEYMLLTFIVVVIISALFMVLKEREALFKAITAPAVAYIKYGYKYGDKDALGWDEGNPRKHVQQSASQNDSRNFRLFLPRDR